ncbi:MAG: hypothetical protein Q6358_06705 [Candidatus Brocadiales bacterium]|nr:hypothetical protein [Candidatus Brocadiales bacterium]
MERENAKKLPSSVWKYSFVIAMTLIIGYIVLVGILLIPISTGNSNPNSSNKDALETIKTITTVFGPWIASLVAFYFAGKQLENVSNQLEKRKRQ